MRDGRWDGRVGAMGTMTMDCVVMVLISHVSRSFVCVQRGEIHTLRNERKVHFAK